MTLLSCMGKREVQTVTEYRIAGDQLTDDPVIALDIAERILQAAEHDRIVYVVATAEPPQADLIEKTEPQQIRATRTSFRDLEVLLLVLYAAYALVVLGVTAFVVMELGPVL
ncbi:hypothetical protein [Mesorhizobium sp. f-mel]